MKESITFCSSTLRHDLFHRLATTAASVVSLYIPAQQPSGVSVCHVDCGVNYNHQTTSQSKGNWAFVCTFPSNIGTFIIQFVDIVLSIYNLFEETKDSTLFNWGLDFQ